MLWETLDECWKEVFRLSWESYKNGTIPVGAVILDENNDIVAKGRNVSYDKKSEHILAGTTIGHAEMVALIQLKKSDHPNIKNYRLYHPPKNTRVFRRGMNWERTPDILKMC